MLTAYPKKALSKWPPEASASVHRVQNGDNWWTLAAKYGRSDPWDIIEFNFETRKPEEVNYYLEKLIGCTKSNDGKNYSFSSSDSPGEIYIPPADWWPDMGPYHYSRAKSLVLDILSGFDDATAPFFSRQTCSRIVEEHISVIEDPKLPVPFEYDYGSVLYMRPTKHEPLYAWLEKEAFHICHGPFGKGFKFTAEAEAASWVCAAASWEMYKPHPKLPFPLGRASYAVYNAAREYVKKYPRTLNSRAMSEIRTAVQRDPLYARRTSSPWKRAA